LCFPPGEERKEVRILKEINVRQTRKTPNKKRPFCTDWKKGSLSTINSKRKYELAWEKRGWVATTNSRLRGGKHFSLL